MKKKIIVPVIIVLLLLAGALSVYFIFFRDGKNEPVNSYISRDVNLSAMAKDNSDTAFSFLKKEEKQLPDDVRGYMIDPLTDINLQNESETAVRTSVDGLFEKVNAISPNTILVKYSLLENYTVGSFDCISYLIESARQKDMTVFFSVSAAEAVSEKLKIDNDKLKEFAEKYDVDGIMFDGLLTLNENANSEKISDAITEMKTVLNEKGIKLGVSLPEKISDISKSLIENSVADFYFVQFDSSIAKGAENNVKAYAALALGSSSRVYGILRNDLVLQDVTGSTADEIVSEVKLIYNYGGFSGCVMYSHEKLASNDNDTATSLYSYYEYFNNSEYTALTITGFSVKDDATVTVTGTSDNKFPVFSRDAYGKWSTVKTSGDDGAFTVTYTLKNGANSLVIKHKNAMYTYDIDKAKDIMSSYSATVDGNDVKLSVVALKGAKVYASLANTVLVEMKESGDAHDGYSQFSASYKLTGGLVKLTDKLVSFAASLDGSDDIVMCNESLQASPYNDNGFGTATLCMVTKNYAETTSTASEDDTSDPTCTPQMLGAVGYVKNYEVSNNNVIYAMTSGMKVYAKDARLILGGYVLPDNNVTLESVDTSSGTTITFSLVNNTFIKTNLDPQKYYKGYLERIYNVKEVTAEYIDIVFVDTVSCSELVKPDFTNSTVISKSEWFLNDDENFITLRLYLKDKGKFYGYSFYRNDDGKFVFSFKNDVTALDGTVIMLDPGHGGYGSPGTSYNSNVYEKDITLSIAKKTYDILTEHGATVVLTRSGDDSLTLAERVQMIRTQNPDLYVSIHCDGADVPSWLGTHTFYYKSYSMPLAKCIHEQLVSCYRTNYYKDASSSAYENVDKNYKFFPYMVTRVEECPSVLVECGYLTNQTDAQFLVSENGQLILATAIAQGIVDYIGNY